MDIVVILSTVLVFITGFSSGDEDDECCEIRMSSNDVDDEEKCDAISFLPQCQGCNMLTKDVCVIKLKDTAAKSTCTFTLKDCLYEIYIIKSRHIKWYNPFDFRSLLIRSRRINTLSSITSTVVTSSTSTNSKTTSDNSKTLMIALIVTFVVALAVILFLIIVICKLRRRKNLSSPETKQTVGPYSQQQDRTGEVLTTKSQNLVDPSCSHTVPKSSNNVYDRPDVDDIEIQPYWDPFNNDSAAIVTHSQFPDSVTTHNDNDGYDVPVGDMVESSVRSQPPVMKNYSNVDACDNTTTGPYFELDDQRVSQNNSTVQTYFVLEGEQDNDAVTTSVSDRVCNANKAGQYSKLGEVARKKDDTYGMIADKTDPDVASRSSSLPDNEHNDNITMATAASDPASVYCLAKLPGTPRENVQHGNENLLQATDHAKTEETSVNYFELESG